MQKVYISICFCLISTIVFSQDKVALANAYVKKVTQSLKATDTVKAIRYLDKALINFGDNKSSKALKIATEIYAAKKEYNKAKEYADLYFKTSKDQKLNEYQEMLLLYIDIEDALIETPVEIKKIKEKPLVEVKKVEVAKVVVGKTIEDTYRLSKENFEKKSYKLSKENLTKYFSLNPNKTSKEYEEMLELFVDIDEKIEESKAKETSSVIPPPPTPEVIEIVEDKNEIEETVPFTVIEEVPVFPGCKGENIELKKCFSSSVQKHFVRKFNADLPNQLGLTPGRKRVSIFFVINKDGIIDNLNVRAPHPKIKEEVINVMNTLPKMKPGIQRGKAIGVKYSIPFTMIVEGNSDKEEN
ncbi:hypothetical protein OD91_2180 [Lutibacter sp. Hel_I_33_5]|uniref:energy transducer TonB n=1 Tax=Lutibacter sp. Hel_I_33_5 TaxID=1566289 RepID=UPI0011ACA2E3|nr:energy transducer TonB [Lutibacter sp. Hel_I_33_5]TVZ56878.1 hypothetical protein OD91_2180 [Lutibacter sp. Hel_I_33_5]